MRTFPSIALIVVMAASLLPSLVDAAPPPNGKAPPELTTKVSTTGQLRVIVELIIPVQPSRQANATAADQANRQAIAATQARVTGALATKRHRLIHRYASMPLLALEVTPEALDALERSPDVLRVTEDRLAELALLDSAPLVGATKAWEAGFDGTGLTVAIIDTCIR